MGGRRGPALPLPTGAPPRRSAAAAALAVACLLVLAAQPGAGASSAAAACTQSGISSSSFTLAFDGATAAGPRFCFRVTSSRACDGGAGPCCLGAGARLARLSLNSTAACTAGWASQLKYVKWTVNDRSRRPALEPGGSIGLPLANALGPVRVCVQFLAGASPNCRTAAQLCGGDSCTYSLQTAPVSLMRSGVLSRTTCCLQGAATLLPCSYRNGGCDARATCSNSEADGTRVCNCSAPGLLPAPDGVSCFDNPPSAADQSFATLEDTPLHVDAPGVLAGAADPEGWPVSAVPAFAQATRRGGKFTLAPDGTLDYTPYGDFNGADGFNFTVVDIRGNRVTASVNITVVSVNDPPTLTGSPRVFTTAPGVPLSVPRGRGVLLNAMDVEGGPLTAALAACGFPTNGSVALASNGSFVYTPAPGFGGQDAFCFVAIDPQGASSPVGNITIIVDAPPSAGAPVFNATEDTFLFQDPPGVLSNASGFGGGALAAVAVTNRATAGGGYVNIRQDGSFTYKGKLNFFGLDYFNFTVVDRFGYSGQGRATVVVAGVNDPPVAGSPRYYRGPANATLYVSASDGLLKGASDPDGDPMTVPPSESAPTEAGGSVDIAANGSFAYTPPGGGFTGRDSFNFTVLDSSGTASVDGSVAYIKLTGDPRLVFNIQLVNVGQNASQDAAFEAARDRWESIIVGDVPDYANSNGLDLSGPDAAGFFGPVDDVVIFYKIAPIDGRGNILGQAGPVWVRKPGAITISGTMTFDSDDIGSTLSQAQFTSVVLHEMGHVLGLNAWTAQTVGCSPACTAASGADVRWSCAAANREYGLLCPGAGAVPIETKAPAGSSCSHWAEAALQLELMTPYYSVGRLNPLSRVTVGAMEDIYGASRVSYAAADPFVCPTAVGRGGVIEPDYVKVDYNVLELRPIGLLGRAGEPPELLGGGAGAGALGGGGGLAGSGGGGGGGSGSTDTGGSTAGGGAQVNSGRL